MIRKNITVCCLAMLSLSGCIKSGPENSFREKGYLQRIEKKPINVQNNDRFEITRTAVVFDDLAYNNERGVYLIKDKQTGREYIGLSGVGIAETGPKGNSAP